MGVIYPVILAGGSGTRLWPLSDSGEPKQFLPLMGERSLLQDTVSRLTSLPGRPAPVIISGARHQGRIDEQLAAIGVRPLMHILEPVARNTAPAIAAAAHLIRQQDPDGLMLVLPADHHITRPDVFTGAVARAMPLARQGHLLTFGIVPDRPETGYGYIRRGAALSEGAFAVDAFVEKPDRATAARYIASGDHFWNSGMFMFAASTLLEEIAIHCNDILTASAKAIDKGRREGGTIHLCGESFGACRAQSFDHAVMEHTRKAAVVPAEMGWSDIGSWAALWEAAEKTAYGNALLGDVDVLDTVNSYIHAGSRHVAVIGVEDLVVVETADAVLIVHRDHVQKVKTIAEAKRTGSPFQTSNEVKR